MSPEPWRILDYVDPTDEFNRQPECGSAAYRRLAGEVIAQCNQTIETVCRLATRENRGPVPRFEFACIDLRGKGYRPLLARIERELEWLEEPDGFAFWVSVLRCSDDETDAIHTRMIRRARFVKHELEAKLRWWGL